MKLIKSISLCTKSIQDVGGHDSLQFFIFCCFQQYLLFHNTFSLCSWFLPSVYIKLSSSSLVTAIFFIGFSCTLNMLNSLRIHSSLHVPKISTVFLIISNSYFEPSILIKTSLFITCFHFLMNIYLAFPSFCAH